MLGEAEIEAEIGCEIEGDADSRALSDGCARVASLAMEARHGRFAGDATMPAATSRASPLLLRASAVLVAAPVLSARAAVAVAVLASRPAHAEASASWTPPPPPIVAGAVDERRRFVVAASCGESHAEDAGAVSAATAVFTAAGAVSGACTAAEGAAAVAAGTSMASAGAAETARCACGPSWRGCPPSETRPVSG
eukprot:2592641-Pleurochrysis_carterae.AAC.2